MDDEQERELQAAAQEAAAIRTLREKFLTLAEAGSKGAMEHVRELERRETAARERIKELHIQRLPVV